MLHSLPSYLGTYRSVVVNVSDPSGSNRVKVICPQISGNAEINWAEPVNPQEPVPVLNSLVWLSFSGGDITKPIYFSNTVIPFPEPTSWNFVSVSTGWALGSPITTNYKGLRYRLDIENNLVISGAIHATAATPTTQLFSVPYTPIAGYSSTVSSATSAGVYKQTASVYLEVTGQAFLNAPSAIASGDSFFVMMQVPLI